MEPFPEIDTAAAERQVAEVAAESSDLGELAVELELGANDISRLHQLSRRHRRRTQKPRHQQFRIAVRPPQIQRRPIPRLQRQAQSLRRPRQPRQQPRPRRAPLQPCRVQSKQLTTTDSVANDKTVVVAVLSNDDFGASEVDNPTLVVTSAPSHGTATVVGINIKYDPEPAYIGSDSFEYEICSVCRRLRPSDCRNNGDGLGQSARRGPNDRDRVDSRDDSRSALSDPHPSERSLARLPGSLLAHRRPGFRGGATGDHFCNWADPPSYWLEAYTALAGVAAATSTLRISTAVTQIPLRSPGVVAHQAITLDQVSGGRFELGLGTGLTIDPGTEMLGITKTGITGSGLLASVSTSRWLRRCSPTE